MSASVVVTLTSLAVFTESVGATAADAPIRHVVGAGADRERSPSLASYGPDDLLGDILSVVDPDGHGSYTSAAGRPSGFAGAMVIERGHALRLYWHGALAADVRKLIARPRRFEVTVKPAKYSLHSEASALHRVLYDSSLGATEHVRLISGKLLDGSGIEVVALRENQKKGALTARVKMLLRAQATAVAKLPVILRVDRGVVPVASDGL